MDKDPQAFAHPQDPQDKYPKPPFKKQKQPWPGLACKMEPPPDHGEKSYRGSGRLLGRKALITAAKYYRRWQDPRLIVAVLNNRDLNMVSWELRALGGSPKVEATQDLPDIDYAAQAEILGLKGLTVAAPGDVDGVWDQALAADRPVVIDVKADPNVIALPPHATFEQTKNLFLALARGDSDRRAIIDQLIKQLAA